VIRVTGPSCGQENSAISVMIGSPPYGSIESRNGNPYAGRASKGILEIVTGAFGLVG